MKYKKSTEEEFNKLNEKIIEIRDSVEEEFDLMELIEDEIKDLFSCNLECKTCTTEEQGACLSQFKKGNLYWLRKIAQDEWMLKSMSDQINTMRELLLKMNSVVSGKLRELGARSDIEETDDEDEIELEESELSYIPKPKSKHTEKEPRPKDDLGSTYIA